jgi:peptidoglycan/LPS O-acetylase OafA/YrhL
MEPLSTDAAPTHERLRHIDALRGIAALLVLWRHVADAFVDIGPNVGGRWIAQWADMVDVGRIGVVAFFLISGYVIPFSIDPTGPRRSARSSSSVFSASILRTGCRCCSAARAATGYGNAISARAMSSSI